MEELVFMIRTHACEGDHDSCECVLERLRVFEKQAYAAQSWLDAWDSKERQSMSGGDMGYVVFLETQAREEFRKTLK